MGKVVITLVVIVSAIFAVTMIKVNNRTDDIPEMLAGNFQDLGDYALQYAIEQVTSGNITGSTTVEYSGEDAFNVLDGSINTLNYIFTYTESESATEATEIFSVSGDLNLNPSNAERNEFQVETPDGWFYRDDLHEDAPVFSYEGPASEVRIKPKGSDRTIMINGTEVSLNPSTLYKITSDSMTVTVWNDHIHKNGKAMGNWWVLIYATNASIVPNPGVPGLNIDTETIYTLDQVEITSNVSVNAQGKVLTHSGRAILNNIGTEGSEELKLVYWNP